MNKKNNLGNPQQKKLFDCQSKEELIPPISLLSKAETAARPRNLAGRNRQLLAAEVDI